MAKINNQEVMQKLIDELKLYPAQDTIPTELAEKILATYLINAEDLSVAIKPTYKLWQDTTPNDSDKTLTVPDGHTYVLKSLMLRYHCDATVATRYPVLIIADASGNTLWVQEFNTVAASNDQYFRGIANSQPAATDPWENNFPLDDFPFPLDMPLLEGYTLRFYAIAGGQAGDDIEINSLVDDQEQ